MKNFKTRDLWVSHGAIEHSIRFTDNCKDCQQVKIAYLEAILKAGGKKKFLEQLSKTVL